MSSQKHNDASRGIEPVAGDPTEHAMQSLPCDSIQVRAHQVPCHRSAQQHRGVRVGASTLPQIHGV